MKQFTSIVMTLLFAIAGVTLAISNYESRRTDGYNAMSAAVLPNFGFPKIDTNTMVIPQGFSPNLKKQSPDTEELTTQNITIDSLRNRIEYLEKKGQVTKVIRRKVRVPTPVVEKDTVRIYYLATQVSSREGSSGECIPVFEVKKVNSLCPEEPSTIEGDE